LAAAQVARLKTRGYYADGGGLYFRVAEGGTRNWVFRFARHGRPREMGLGSALDVTLAEAREKASECRRKLLNDIDPIEARRGQRMAERIASAKAKTFDECMGAYIAEHEAGWHNRRHAEEWARSRKYLKPIIGELPVSAIDTPLVLKALKPIWVGKTVTATRVRGRIENVLGWATVHHYRAGDNPARWQGHLEHALPARSDVTKIEHLTALPYAEVPAFVARLRERTSTAARALEFTILTAVRAGETCGMTWAEIDLEARTWTIPASRMKAGEEHRVPLSVPATVVLKQMQEIARGDYVFEGAAIGKPVSRQTLLKLCNGHTVHGFRSSFRDWAAERTSFPREVAEMALAHTIPSAVEAAYRRGDLFEKRRRLMEAWSNYCSKPTAAGKVLPIRTR
jgi:integrase